MPERVRGQHQSIFIFFAWFLNGSVPLAVLTVSMKSCEYVQQYASRHMHRTFCVYCLWLPLGSRLNELKLFHESGSFDDTQ